LRFARRSSGETPGAGTPVWLADTLGEMGLWFQIAPAAVICGSFVDGIGGHNPVEATRAGAAVITGPYTASFDEVYAAYDARGARRLCRDAADTADAVLAAWRGSGTSVAAAEQAVAALSGGALGRTLEALLELLETPR
jgi:3-deoxy-D-manno-octulosonic-acid transferase